MIEGDKGFLEEVGVKNFSPSFESFISLVERTYTQVCTADKQFQRHVSLSMYVYCNVLHLHARIAAIRQHTGKSITEENNLVMYFKSCHYPVHEPVNPFLRGIGDFTDPSGTYHTFSIRVIPGKTAYAGINGFYGPVTNATHVIYETYAAPGVAAQRVHEDYLYTTQQNRDPIWDLPEGVRPVEQIVIANPEVVVAEGIENEGDDPPVEDEAPPEHAAADPAAVSEVGEPVAVRPTANLLGWGRATKLTTEPRQTIENCGIGGEEEGFPSEAARFCLNNGFFEHTAAQVTRSSQYYKTDASLHEHITGSQAQCAFVEKGEEAIGFNRLRRYVEGNIRACSSYQLEYRMSIAARVMAYRMRKEPADNRQSWCCYDFNQYQQVPQNWIDTRNGVFNYGSVTPLNAATKYTEFTEKDRLSTSLLVAGFVNKKSF